MTQANDLGQIDNQPGATYRARVNENIKALASFHDGATAPDPVHPNMLWFDSGTGTVKLRNPTNTGWAAVGTIGPPFTWSAAEAIDAAAYGAIGDGVADDTVALQAAIDAAGAVKRPLRLPGGKTYRITAQLLVSAGIAIIGDAANRPVIKTDGQDFDPIKVSGFFVKTTTLDQSATVNTKWIKVADATSTGAGMLVEVVSSASWYHDPRPTETDARKAELHRMVGRSGNYVYLQDPLFDGYNVGAETVTVNFYTPIRFYMEHVDIQMVLPAPPTDSIRKVGIRVEYTIHAMLSHVWVYNAAATGILLHHCYAPTVDGGKTEGANTYFSGYGVQVGGCTRATVRNRHFWQCRRGVDVSGGNIPSHLTVVESNWCFGGGVNSMGDQYAFTDTYATGAAQSGVGTHGPADHTIVRGNWMGFLEYGVVSRGRNTIIEDNYFIGDFRRSCIVASFGANLTVRNNTAYDGFTAHKHTGVYDGGGNIYNRQPNHFISFWSTFDGFLVGKVTIANNDVYVEEAFIELASDNIAISAFQTLEVYGNTVRLKTATGADPAYFIRALTGLTLINYGAIFNNHIKRDAGSGRLIHYGNCEPRHETLIGGVRTYTFYLLTDTAGSVHLGNDVVTYARVAVECPGANGCVRVQQGDTDTVPWGTATNITCVAGALTGTTGAANRVNLSLQNGVLYVENRRDTSQRIFVTVLHTL